MLEISTTLIIHPLMLNIIRRGPASALRLLSSASLCSRCIRAAKSRDSQQLLPRCLTQVVIRSFGSAPQLRWTAAATASYEDEAINGELEQDVNAEEPPSDAQIKRAINYGPVTKFHELSERGMVCPTVVDTITRGMGLETMTQVQSLTINETLKGIDV